MYKKVAPAFFVATSLALAACGNIGVQGNQEVVSQEESSVSAPSIDRQSYSNIHAVFDAEKQTVETPLEKYVHSPEEQIIIMTASYIHLKQCAVDKGQELPHHFYQVEYKSDVPFGVWSSEFAEKYGYQLNNSLGKVYVDEGYKGEDIPSEMQKNFESCHDEVSSQNIPYFIKGVAASEVTETAVLSEVSGQVNHLLEEDSDVQLAIKEWIQCLEEKGIPIDTNYDQPIPVIPEDKEANIKQALIDVQCKKDVRLMERYYDAEAQYEQALIEKNQAAFNTLGERKEAYLNQAKEILLQNGITP